MRLIDADEAKEKAKNLGWEHWSLRSVLLLFDAMPTIDGATVEPPGWIPVEDGNHKCSRCHTVRKTDVARDHYCPNCGEPMHGEVGSTD